MNNLNKQKTELDFLLNVKKIKNEINFSQIKWTINEIPSLVDMIGGYSFK